MKALKLSVIFLSSLIMTSTMHAIFPIAPVSAVTTFAVTGYGLVQKKKAYDFEDELVKKAQSNDFVAEQKLIEYRKHYKSSNVIPNCIQALSVAGSGNIAIQQAFSLGIYRPEPFGLFSLLNSAVTGTVHYCSSVVLPVVCISATVYDVYTMKKAKKASDAVTSETLERDAKKINDFVKSHSEKSETIVKQESKN